MNRIITLLCLVLFVSGLAACAEPPPKYGNSPEQQRKNAKDAQDELSTDINKGVK